MTAKPQMIRCSEEYVENLEHANRVLLEAVRIGLQELEAYDFPDDIEDPTNIAVKTMRDAMRKATKVK